MFLVFGQFWNQTRASWDWQQIGGVCTIESDADQYAEGFAINYGMTVKVIGRSGVRMYLPPVQADNPLHWPDVRAEVVPQ